MSQQTRILHIDIIKRLPYELAWDIWNRYYTYVVLSELLATPAAIRHRLFDNATVEYIFLDPDERARFAALPSTDEDLVFYDRQLDKKTRRRYWRLEYPSYRFSTC